jgi:hypothetical protein
MKNLYFAVFLMYSYSIMAQFPADTPYSSIAPPALTLPAVYTSVEDTSVPDAINITRITEYVQNWDWYPYHEYAKIQPWNADATIYKFFTVAIYDATTHQKIRDLPSSPLYPTYWANTNADILYGFKENGDIKSYSISTQQIDLLGHIYLDEAGQTDYEFIKLGPGEGNIDKNDHFVAFIGKYAADMDVIVYDLQTNTVVHRETFAGAWGNNTDVPEYIDWVSVSQSGDYVGIMWNHNTTSINNPFSGHFGVELYRTNDMQYLRRIADYGNHGDFGYAQDGKEVFVQFWGDTGTLNMFYLDRMQRVVLQTHNDFAGEGHVSCRNLNRPGWAYVSQDEATRSGQMVAVKLDNSGLIEHFGHHFSSSSTYDKSPMPVPTPNGDKIMFKSDFGNSAVTREVFAFEAVKSSASAISTNRIPNVEIYPNPINDIFWINGLSKIEKIAIYNNLGQLVRQIQPNTNQIDISDLKQGVYLIKILTNNNLIHKKLIKK